MPENLYQRFIERYLNKKEIMYRLPLGVNIDTFWANLVEARKDYQIKLPLLDQKGTNFWLCLTDGLKQRIKLIDDYAKENFIQNVPKIIEDKIIFDALIDEAFNSSVIEGAFSTKKRTIEMVKNNLKPVNKSEQMIINNYKALEFILSNLDHRLDETMILSIYKIVTEDTLEQDDQVEKYRNDSVFVFDYTTQKTIYEAPPHSQVQSLMDSLVEFINTDDSLHPVIKSCIIHFYFVYIHPFFDGNGRTARAISYMYLLQKHYDFFKFFSVSSIIKEEKNSYFKAIKSTEDYESDLTYFIDFYSTMIINSIIRTLKNFEKEYSRRSLFIYLERAGIILSKRQNKAMIFYLTNQKSFTTINEYAKKYKVAYETARTDLSQLETIGLFKKTKTGKKFIYKLNNISEILGKYATAKDDLL